MSLGASRSVARSCRRVGHLSLRGTKRRQLVSQQYAESYLTARLRAAHRLSRTNAAHSRCHQSTRRYRRGIEARPAHREHSRTGSRNVPGGIFPFSAAIAGWIDEVTRLHFMRSCGHHRRITWPGIQGVSQSFRTPHHQYSPCGTLLLQRLYRAHARRRH